MRTLKKAILLSAISFTIAGCGGGGSETPVSLGTPAAPTGQSEYDKQTKAARIAFEQRLSNALAEAENWLDENRRTDGVVVTASGLQYRVDRPSPNPTGKNYEGDEVVTVHYEGQLIDGTVFDSSFERGRPERLKPSELIPGWQEALSLMQPGDEWTLFIPPGLGYGALGKGGGIPPNAALIFRVKLR